MFDKIILWLSRILGLSLIIVLIVFAFGEDVPGIKELSSKEILIFIAILIMIAGVILGFWKDLIGSIVILTGYVFFSILEGKILAGPVFPQFLIVALLYYYNSRNFN